MCKLNRILITIFISLTVEDCKSQNLIANGSFENYTAPVNCSGGSGGFDNYSVFPVNHVVDNWYGYYTPDFLTSNCSGIYSNGSPTNLFGYSYPKDGNNYVGIGLYQKGNEVKEYIYQTLSTSLQAGKIYCLSFYVKRSYRSTYATKNIEVYFSNNLVSTGSLGYIVAMPQITKQNVFISDTSNWMQLQGCFTANGGEQYMTIGNFNSNANTDTLFIGTNNPILSYGDFSHYYIDDITLIDQTTVGLQNTEITDSFEIYPNPTIGLIHVSKELYSHEDYTFKILDLFGREIVSEDLKQEIDISSFDKGVYTLLLYKNKHLVVTKKVMKD